MKRSNSKSKAPSAFKKLGAVALITATIFFVACKQTSGSGGGGKPTPKPKHAINFSVDSTTPNGTLKAKADDVDETEKSPISIEEGKTVTFTAKADDGYRVKGWTLDGKPITEAGKSNTYAHIVTKVATITVSFEAIPKHAITFSVEGANGTLTAKVDGGDIASGKEVEEGKAVTFMATANAGYRVKGWTLDGNAVNGTAETYTLAVTQPATVKVNFELSSVEGGAVLILSPDKLNIKVRAKTEDGSAIQVEGCTETTLASYTETTLTAKGTKVVLKGNITGFYCSGILNGKQPLTALNVQGLTSLQELFCHNNQLTELNVQGCASLQELSCWNNKLTSLNVQGLTALQELECSLNKLTALDVSGLTALQKLRCNSNQLSELNVQGCTSLQKFSCSYNKLPKFNVSGLPALQELWCNDNQLSTLDVQGLTSLKELYCHSNQLNAQAMTELLKALPSREASAKAVLYTENTDETEGNCKDYNTPADLKKAFDGAKNRNWELKKKDESGREVDI